MSQEDGASIEGKSSSAWMGISPASCLGAKSRTNIKPTKSVANMKNEADTGAPGPYKKEHESSYSRPGTSRKYKLYDSTNQQSGRSETPKRLEEKRFPNSEFLVSDCWKASLGETPMKFVDLFRENNLDDMDEANAAVKKKRLDANDDDKSPPYTKEFHLLTEVQKARILTAVEDTIKKLAYEDHYQGSEETGGGKMDAPLSHRTSFERFFCKKFLLPWVIIKVIEMFLCHIIQLIFLSQDSFFQRKNEFLPIVVTYYLTLFTVVISLVAHISCFSYSGLQNPCYFMGVISSSIFTLITSIGILIMLTSIEYYTTFPEILVLVFIGVLLCALSAELCLCYVEVKKVWNRVGPNEQYYLN